MARRTVGLAVEVAVGVAVEEGVSVNARVGVAVAEIVAVGVDVAVAVEAPLTPIPPVTSKKTNIDNTRPIITITPMRLSASSFATPIRGNMTVPDGSAAEVAPT